MLNKTTTSLALILTHLPCFAVDLPPLSPCSSPHTFVQTFSNPSSLTHRLADHEEIFGSKQSLKGVRTRTWDKANTGNKKALKRIIDHKWHSLEQTLDVAYLITTRIHKGDDNAKEMLCNFIYGLNLNQLKSLFNQLTSSQDRVRQRTKIGKAFTLMKPEVLDALVLHTPLHTYALRDYFHPILEFIQSKALNPLSPNFDYQEKLLEAYRDGHYGIKKKYKRNKRTAFQWMVQFATEHQNPKAQAILLNAYKNGHFGIKKNSHPRAKEAIQYLEQFSTTDDPHLKELIQQAHTEGWFGLVPLVEGAVLESSLGVEKKFVTKEQFTRQLHLQSVQEISKALAEKIDKSSSPVTRLRKDLEHIAKNGIENLPKGGKASRRLALDVLKTLAIDYNNYPSQTLLVEAYHEGYFGINSHTRKSQDEGLLYLNIFSELNYHVQMLHLTALTEGWFNIDPSDHSIQTQTLALAKHYAKGGNRKAQEFLINTLSEGRLGTRKDKDRYKKVLKLRNRYNIYPAQHYRQDTNPFELLGSDL